MMLARYSMQTKLIGALAGMSAIALLALAWFALTSISGARAEAREADEAGTMIQLGTVVGDLIHELQIERGMTVGYLASDGQNFGTELPATRSAVDEALSAVEAHLADHGEALPAAVVRQVVGATSDLQRIDGLRTRADALDAAAAEAASYYTGVISDFLAGLDGGFAGIAQGELLREATAYSALIGAKEAAGQARAQLNAAFTTDAFGDGQFELVSGLVREQTVLLDSFLAYASDGPVQRYQQHTRSPAFQRVADHERTALDGGGSGGFGVAASDWFSVATERIDLLRDVEEAQAAHLLERADALEGAANRQVLLATVLSLVTLTAMLALGGGLTLWVRRSVVGPLTRNAQALASSSGDMSAVATQVGSNSEETAAQAGVVASAGEQVSQNIQAVATAVEELTSSIGEIARNASQATNVATEAVDTAANTNTIIGQLGESSAEIGRVIDLITTIAEQTNLLALNATIEAARAGEAGKGFAVVANEVKDLAKATAQATDEVGQRIAAIQEDTGRAVTAIGQISDVVQRIADLQTTIASAVEEQNSATSEIARSVNEAAQGSSEIAENITGVASAAQDTTEGAARTQQAAHDLARMAEQLDVLVFGAGRVTTMAADDAIVATTSSPPSAVHDTSADGQRDASLATTVAG